MPSAGRGRPEIPLTAERTQLREERAVLMEHEIYRCARTRVRLLWWLDGRRVLRGRGAANGEVGMGSVNNADPLGILDRAVEAVCGAELDGLDEPALTARLDSIQLVQGRLAAERARLTAVLETRRTRDTDDVRQQDRLRVRGRSDPRGTCPPHRGDPRGTPRRPGP